MASKFLILILVIFTTLFVYPASSQMTSPCTPSMITAFMPCMSFVTNNSSNGISPTVDCCNSLRSLMSNGKDCLCLIANGGIPFQIPNLNSSLGMSLPRACNMPGVPLQCKDSPGNPVPIPGNLPPFPAPSPRAPSLPEGNVTQTPPAATNNSEAPTSREGLTPSAAYSSHSASPLLLVAALGPIIAFNYYY